MAYLFPKAVEESRTEANSDSVDDALQLLADAHQKFRYYQGHRVRCVNARDSFGKLEAEELEWVKKYKKASGKCIIVIDWKMKFLAERCRESSMHHFAKRGLPWHEAVLWWYAWDEESKDVVKYMVALDQILGTGNKQDGATVLCSMEALMRKINVELPHLTKGILKSDNAGCYHHKTLVLGIPLLNMHSKKFKVTTYIHSETQDGKFMSIFNCYNEMTLMFFCFYKFNCRKGCLRRSRCHCSPKGHSLSSSTDRKN